MKYTPCPLCSSSKVINFSKDKKREYLKCINCNTIFVPPQYYLTESEEKKGTICIPIL